MRNGYFHFGNSRYCPIRNVLSFLRAALFKHALQFFFGRQNFQQFRIHLISGLICGYTHRLQEVLREVISEHPVIVVTYFEPDKKKAGGAYKTIEGQLQNIDEYAQCLVMKDGKVVFIRSVLDISVSGY